MESELSRLAQAAYPMPSFESKGRAEPRVGCTLFRPHSFSSEGCGAQREGKAQKGHKNCTWEMKTYPGGTAATALSATCSVGEPLTWMARVQGARAGGQPREQLQWQPSCWAGQRTENQLPRVQPSNANHRSTPTWRSHGHTECKGTKEHYACLARARPCTRLPRQHLRRTLMRTLLGEVTLHLAGGKRKCRRKQRPMWNSKPQTTPFLCWRSGRRSFQARKVVCIFLRQQDAV